MQISTKDWLNYIKMLSKLNDEAGKLMQQYVAKHGFADTEAIVDYAYGLITTYGEGSAALAAEMYDATAALSGVVVPAAEVAETAKYSDVAKAIYGTIKHSKNPNSVGNTVSRYVKMAGADTTLKNAERDGAQFAWVPMGDTCSFCITLASRGWQYMSKKAMKNGHAEHIHANCDCTYSVRFDSKSGVRGYNPDKYKAMYDNAEGNTPEEKINSMRRMQYQDPAVRDRIRAQKREAYAVRTGNTAQNIKVSKQSAYDSYFEYENAQMMKQYSKTGIMPKENINGVIVSLEDRARLKAEADFIQNNVENTKVNTLYRGMVMNADEVRSLTPGDTYVIDSLTSTSLDKKLSSIYSNIENAYSVEDPVPIMVTIQQSGGIYGFRLNKDTPEVILPKGQSYRVAKNYMDDDGVVHLELYAKKGSNKPESEQLYRKTHNTGEFSRYEELMTQKHVKNVVSDMDLDPNDVKYAIDRNVEMINTGYMGHTSDDGKRITLYPDAFANREQLVKTIGHENIHLNQVRSNGKVKTEEELILREQEAYASEEEWWDKYVKRTGYRS